jgi:hypothetical protein
VYRVDLKLCKSSGGGWIIYTAPKRPVDLDFAMSLFRGLQRQGAGARVVDVESGKVVDECGEKISKP